MTTLKRWNGTDWEYVGPSVIYNPPTIGVYNNANISLPDNVSTVITWNSERWKSGITHSTSSNTDRIVIDTPGVYHIEFQCQLAAGTDYTQILPILQTDATQDIAYGIRINWGANSPLIRVTRDIKLTAGQYVRALVYQDNTANAARNLEFNGFISPEMTVTWIAAG